MHPVPVVLGLVSAGLCVMGVDGGTAALIALALLSGAAFLATLLRPRQWVVHGVVAVAVLATVSDQDTEMWPIGLVVVGIPALTAAAAVGIFPAKKIDGRRGDLG